jgi:hypothetical protein
MTDTIARLPGESDADFARRLRAHARDLSRVRTRHLGVRVTEAEAAELTHAADVLGISVSDLLRRAGAFALEAQRARTAALPLHPGPPQCRSVVEPDLFTAFGSSVVVNAALASGRISPETAEALNAALRGEP